jgi:hypothetical protein
MVSERGWSHVAAHLEMAIASIPRPDFDAITNPREIAKRLKSLCKRLRAKLKDIAAEVREMSFHVYSLLVDLSEKLHDLVLRLFEYVSDKVKGFLAWINSLIDGARARFRHSD